jgi:hypothetical protein
MKLRKIPASLPARVVRHPDRRYRDRDTGYLIAVQDVKGGARSRIMMVAYEQHEKHLVMITVHPMSRQQEANRISSGRWIVR